MSTLNFLCCFCNQTIESSHVNPCDINILINVNKHKDQQYNQSFYCHIACFREKLNPALKLHFHIATILD